MEEEEHGSMIEEREEEYMVPPNSGAIQTKRKAHFLKPIISNPKFKQIRPNLPSSNLPNPQILLIKKRVKFLCKLKPIEGWKSWVENLQQIHQQTWKKAGIFDAIKCSTYHIVRDKELIIRLAEKWCPATNTFFFSWGECSITLEDVMILGGFSVSGISCRGEFGRTVGGEILQEKLMEACRRIKKQFKSIHVSHIAWLKYFKGKRGELEHVSFLVLWLSRYVFTMNSFDIISLNAFSIAVSISRGTRFALAPVVLASIYRDLRLLKDKIVRFKGETEDDSPKLVLRAQFQLVHVWAWERFLTLGPKPTPLVKGEPRVARWHGINKSKNLRFDIGSSTGDNFLWRPYALQLENWELPKFYCDKEKSGFVNSEVDEQILSFVRCLRVCELVGVDCVEQYLPNRVAMQFALDQDIPLSVPRLNADDYQLAWNSYDKPLDGLKFYLPPRSFEGDVTLNYSDWWRTPLALSLPADDFERRKRSTRKLRKVSQVVNADYEWNSKLIRSCSTYNTMGVVDSLGSSSRGMPIENSSSCQADELGEDNVINLQVGVEDSDKCEDNVAIREEVEIKVDGSNMNMVEGNKSSEGIHSANKLHLTLTLPACYQAMDSDFVGTGSDIPSYDYVADENVSCSLINSLIGPEEEKEKLESNGIGRDESCLNLGEGNHSPSDIHLSLSSPTCNEVMDSNVVRGSSPMPNENTPSCKSSILSQAQEHITNEIVLANVTNLLIGVEEDKGKFECNSEEKDKEKDISESSMNLSEGTCTQHAVNGRSLTDVEPLMGSEVNTLSSMPCQDEQGEAREDAKSKQANSSQVDVVILSDEEDNIGIRDPFEESYLAALDARFSRLEKLVSALRAAKLKSKEDRALLRSLR
ncbi:hypothetical protein SOVF_050280 [Spinacia oleracea]|nr:hypothetical protein SOVF_050280 [Spinacia oleracea]